MKHKLLALTFLFIACTNSITAQNKCGYDEWVQMHNHKHPGYKAAIDNDIVNALNTNNDRSDDFADKIYTIRVVFHIVYNTTAQNVTDVNINKQIDALNRDFGAYNADIVNVRPMFAPYISGDTHIRFELATTKPDGTPTNGIERKQTSSTYFYNATNVNGVADAVKSSATGGLDAWDPSKYLNIWTCVFNTNSSAGDIVAYSTPPSNFAPYWINNNSDPMLQGIVMNPVLVGDNLTATISKGRLCVHEVGHYLGLRHIWGDIQNICSEDFIWDTPPSSERLLGWSWCNGKPTVIRKFRVLQIGTSSFYYPATYAYDTIQTFKLQFNNATYVNDTVWQTKVRIDKFDNAATATTIPEADSTGFFYAYPSDFWTYKRDTIHAVTFILDTITGITNTVISIQTYISDSIYFAPLETIVNVTYTRNLFPNTCNWHTYNPNLPIGQNDLGDFPDLIENYMSFTDEQCTVSFTNEQRRLMQNVLLNYRPGIATITINGLNAVELSSKLRFAPNPANEFITIDNAASNSTFEISNISGQTVFAGVLESKIIDVSSLTNGIYTIKVSAKNNTLVNKLVVAK